MLFMESAFAMLTDVVVDTFVVSLSDDRPYGADNPETSNRITPAKLFHQFSERK